MKVGLTYDLRQEYLDMGYSEEETAEFDRPDTIDSIENALLSLGFITDRIGHVKTLVKRLAKGDRWDIVFNVAEGLRGFGREALIPSLLEAYEIPCVFSDPMVLALTLHKGMTKRVIRDLNIPTPDFAIIETKEDIEKINLPYPLFAKPIAEGTGKGVTSKSKIKNQQQLYSVSQNIIESFKQPVLIETYLPGREFTVGIVGTGKDALTLGVVEVILKEEAQQDAYTYLNKEQCEKLIEYKLVNDPEAKKATLTALEAWIGLGCRDGGRVDLRSDINGIPNFIEVNPLPGIHPEHSDLPIICTKVGISYKELIEKIIKSAIKRNSIK